MTTRKICSSCGETKDIGEFWRLKRSLDGMDYYCIACRKKHTKRFHITTRGKELKSRIQKRYLKNNPTRQSDYYAKIKRTEAHEAQSKAHRKVLRMIRSGKMKKASAYLCAYHYEGCTIQADDWHHHEGYAPENQLNVIPVCRSCHKTYHVSRDMVQSP